MRLELMTSTEPLGDHVTTELLKTFKEYSQKNLNLFLLNLLYNVAQLLVLFSKSQGNGLPEYYFAFYIKHFFRNVKKYNFLFQIVSYYVGIC